LDVNFVLIAAVKCTFKNQFSFSLFSFSYCQSVDSSWQVGLQVSLLVKNAIKGVQCQFLNYSHSSIKSKVIKAKVYRKSW